VRKLIVKDWRAVVPSSPEQQIEPERIRGAQEAVARGNALPHDIGSAGILILAVLAIVYTLYFGKEILLPIALALVLKLLMQPAMRLLHERLRLPGALAALLLIIAVFGAIAAVGFTISVPASGWIQKAPESLPLLKEKLAILRQPLDYLQNGLKELESMTSSTGGPESAL
jgi:predicted PurR-regulated permease PerM